MADVKFTVEAKSDKAQASIKKLDKNINQIEKSTKSAAGGFKSLAAKVAVGVAGFYAAVKALKGFTRFMGDAIEKAGIQEQAEKDVQAALEATGREVAANTEHFKKYASQLQQATVYGDEQILNAQSLLIQLTKLDREGLDAATKGAIGLASVYKTDLFAATTLVGKALAGNYGALSRYGIVVERTASDEVKRTQLLEQLAVMYKRAEAETDTYQGTVKQLQNTYGDLKEEAGKAVTESEELRDVMKDINQVMRDIIDSEVIPEIFDSISEGFKILGKFDVQFIVLKRVGDLLHKKAEKARAAREELKALGKVANEIVGYIRPFQESIKITTEQIDTQITSIKGVVAQLSWWETGIVSVKEVLDNVQPTLESHIYLIEEILPLMRDLTGVLEQAQPVLEGYAFTYIKAMGEMTEAQQEFAAIALGEFVAMEAGIKGFVTAIMSTFEKWAIGQIIPKIMAALPFPINLLATGGAIAAIKAIFAGIKSMETGGVIEREGIYHLHAGETVVPTSKTMNIYNQSREGSRAVFNLHITTTKAINAEQLFRDMEEQARRRGYKLNG